MDYHTRPIKIREEIGDKLGMAYSLINIGNTYRNIGDYNKPLDYYTRSLIILEELDGKGMAGYCLMNIGIVYAYQGNYEKALEYYEKSLNIQEEMAKEWVDLGADLIGGCCRIGPEHIKNMNAFFSGLHGLRT